MIADQILAVIRDELTPLAPEVDFARADRNRPIQQKFDIDSMDFLNFITALHQRVAVNVPESDDSKVATIAGAAAYLAARTRD
jgi:acyl carrier protein